MKTKKKNKILTFCFSFMPGAAEMYMGFLRTGLSLMCRFLFSVIILGSLRLDELAVSIGIIIWFYSFFHANHLASLSDEEFAEVKDEYFASESTLLGNINWAQRYQKVIAGLLITGGVILLWNTATDIVRNYLPEYVWQVMNTVGNYVPRVVVAVVIIIVGIKLIRGRKAQLAGLEEKNE